MTGRHRAERRRSPIQIAATAVLAATATTPLVLWASTPAALADACSSAAGKCYTVTVAPASFASGASVPFTVTITNESPSQTLGSVNLTPPAVYSITSVDAPTPNGSATLASGTIQLRNVNLATNGGTETLTLTADTVAGAYSWTSAAKQSNDFNGLGNDFVLDASNSSLTTTGSGTGNNCGPNYVSCGTNFINFHVASKVSTGNAANATNWLVGTASFPATPATGGQRYSMKAPKNPGNFCPSQAGSLGQLTQCTFEMDMDPIPAPYDSAHSVTLLLECDITVCTPAAIGQGSTGTGLFNLVKVSDSGQETIVLRCGAPGAGSLCYDTGTATDGNFTVTVHGIIAGDPKFAGTCFDGCYPSIS